MTQGSDGRRAISERNRAAVVDALLGLHQDGVLEPTAPQVAERAGLSLRTVFAHHRDREALYASAGETLLQRVQEQTMDPDWTALTPQHRLDAFVRLRSVALEYLRPTALASLLLEHSSPAVRANREALQALGEEQLRQAFAPELAAVSGRARTELLRLLRASSQFAYWHALRDELGLDVATSRRLLHRQLTALLDIPR